LTFDIYTYKIYTYFVELTGDLNVTNRVKTITTNAKAVANINATKRAGVSTLECETVNR
jgi:hypothetical protein